MTPAAAASLLIAHAASVDENEQLAGTATRRPYAEALAMTLWRYREEIVELVEERHPELKGVIA